MRKKISIAIILFLIFSNIFGQSTKIIVAKIRPLNTLVLQNINLQFEYVFIPRLSIELHGLWKRKKWFNSGAFESSSWFYRCNGYELGVSSKFYLKRNAPEGFFGAVNFRYNYYLFDNFKQNLGRNTNEFRVVDISEKGPELGIYLGWQNVLSNKITTELCLGVGRFNRVYKEILISGDSYGFNDGVILKKNHWNTLQLNLTIGYCFKKSK